jgi:hypothetical protein
VWTLAPASGLTASRRIGHDIRWPELLSERTSRYPRPPATFEVELNPVGRPRNARDESHVRCRPYGGCVLPELLASQMQWTGDQADPTGNLPSRAVLPAESILQRAQKPRVSSLPGKDLAIPRSHCVNGASGLVSSVPGIDDEVVRPFRK